MKVWNYWRDYEIAAASKARRSCSISALLGENLDALPVWPQNKPATQETMTQGQP